MVLSQNETEVKFNMIEIVNEVLFKFWDRFTSFLPEFFGGLFILIIGIILAGLLRRLLSTIFSFARLSEILQKTNLLSKQEVKIWEEVLAEILRWTVVILFLIPTLEIWNLSKASTVINQFLLYLPNVIIAVIIAFVGIISANLGYDLVKHSVKTVGATSANTLSTFAKWIIIFFTILIILNQLGVAQDLVRILFTGIVIMISLAGGLAFGLGGKDIAKGILEELKNKFK